eukprot:12715654-Alexandrium_andersonii.AAC.1
MSLAAAHCARRGYALCARGWLPPPPPPPFHTTITAMLHHHHHSPPLTTMSAPGFATGPGRFTPRHPTTSPPPPFLVPPLSRLPRGLYPPRRAAQ